MSFHCFQGYEKSQFTDRQDTKNFRKWEIFNENKHPDWQKDSYKIYTISGKQIMKDIPQYPNWEL